MSDQEAVLEIVRSAVTGGGDPEDALSQLEQYDIDWYVTEQGDLMLRYWHVGAKKFVPVEHIARIRRNQKATPNADELEWVSRELTNLQDQFPGQWIAVKDGAVIASDQSLGDLLAQVQELGVASPFITEIPASDIVWTTTYARQEL